MSKKSKYTLAYEALLKKLNVKKIYVAFYAGNTTYRYRCVPNLQAIDCNGQELSFKTNDHYHRFDYAYIRSLNASLPKEFSPAEVAQYVFKLLKDNDLYIEEEIALTKGTCAEQMLVEADLSNQCLLEA